MKRTGFVLIELLIVLAIILALGGGYLALRGKSSDKAVTDAAGDGREATRAMAQTIPGKALQKAESVECQSNLNQVRQSVRMDMDSGGTPPADIATGATASVSKCPVSGQPYQYDPQSGRVWCTTPGHEKY